MSKPDRMSFEGMVWNANKVLDKATKATERKNATGIPKDLFEKCKGIVLISILEVGFVFSGNVGTGIVLEKKDDGVSWSNPVACGLTGVGWGLLVGGSVKDVMIFIMDENSLSGMTSDNGLKLGGQAEITIGPWGRAGKADLGLGTKGASATVSVAFGMGFFLGLSVEGAVVGSRNAVNEAFYGKDGVTAKQIMAGTDVTMPTDKPTVIDEVYEKLKKLQEKAEPAAEGEDKKEEAEEK